MKIIVTATESCFVLACDGDGYSAKQCDGDQCYCADTQTGLKKKRPFF